MNTLWKDRVDSKIRSDGRTVKDILVFYQGGSQVRVNRTDAVNWKDVEKAVVRFEQSVFSGPFATSNEITIKAPDNEKTPTKRRMPAKAVR